MRSLDLTSTLVITTFFTLKHYGKSVCRFTETKYDAGRHAPTWRDDGADQQQATDCWVTPSPRHLWGSAEPP
jgi:hypothetical protein